MKLWTHLVEADWAPAVLWSVGWRRDVAVLSFSPPIRWTGWGIGSGRFEFLFCLVAVNHQHLEIVEGFAEGLAFAPKLFQKRFGQDLVELVPVCDHRFDQ